MNDAKKIKYQTNNEINSKSSLDRHLEYLGETSLPKALWIPGCSISFVVR